MTTASKSWTLGQLVTSQSEPELGLGLIAKTMADMVEIVFPAAETRRRYSARAAPLRRVVFGVGQKVRHADSGEIITIERVENRDGLLCYFGRGFEDGVYEHQLDPRSQDFGALDQFLMGQWSSFDAYDLRKDGWKLKAVASDPHTRGLVGPRVSLLPHQLYIASEVSRRPMPRVLLGDEVGLGKTIEAGLILSSLHHLGRAERVLALVPDALKTQWLAEMFRRFNLMFSILDEERCLGEEETQPNLSPFESNNLVICSLEFLMSDEKRLKQAVDAGWDLTIFDEAHHLHWSASDPSPAWLAARELSLSTIGLLLLTATPGQHGLETQFGLLNLVDPERYPDYNAFVAENGKLYEVAGLSRAIMNEGLSAKSADTLRKLFSNDADLEQAVELALKQPGPDSRDALLETLIDRHGTGRVVFRNRRERLKGFPPRRLESHELEPDAAISAWLKENVKDDSTGAAVLRAASTLGSVDVKSSRVGKRSAKHVWLKNYLSTAGNEKIFLICSSPEAVRQIDAFLQEELNLKRALFHEDMELVERDRQAAWFADPKGAQLLISSEIGGEGRNFQFCSRLILFDLPAHPDLLEQRIGRLDRIGQKREISIVVPWLKGTPEEVLFHWYHEGLGAFENFLGGAAPLAAELEPKLVDILKRFAAGKKAAGADKALTDLISETRVSADEHRKRQRENVDVLIDFNSFREKPGRELKSRIERIEAGSGLREYMSRIFEFFGVDVDDFDVAGSLKVTASSLMYVEDFPELSSDEHGTIVTFSRELATTREDFTFLTPDHPMVQGSLGLMLERNLGQASACRSWAEAGRSSKGVAVQFLFLLQPMGAPDLGLERFLAPEVLELSYDHKGQLKSQAEIEALDMHDLGEDESTLKASMGRIREFVPALFERAQAEADKRAKRLVASAVERATSTLSGEESRLKYLQRVNRSVSKSELESFQALAEETIESLRATELRLDAVRMILL